MNISIQKDSIVALVPARGGSKGVHRKNIKHLGGFPLIAYTIAACQLSKRIDRIVVSTDDNEIASIAKKYGAEVPFLRPSEMAGDSSPDFEFIDHALRWFLENENTIPEFVAHMRPTTPLRQPKIIDRAIDEFVHDGHCSSMRSAHLAPESPYKWFLRDDNCFVPFNRELSLDEINRGRETFDDVYIPDGYVDILRSDIILSGKELYGDSMYAFVSPFCTEVDTLDEFSYIEYELEKKESEIHEYLKNRYSTGE